MSCAPFDLRDYYFEALAESESRQVRDHLTRCPECAAELEQLRLTGLALRSVQDEEIPRRIAFVSDKVFEPSTVMRWWQALWLSGARMAALAAMVLAGAILVHAYRMQPATYPVKVIERTTLAAADSTGMREAINQAVSTAVAESEARFDLKLKRVTEENVRQKRETMDRVAEVLDAMDRRSRVMTVASNALPEAGQ